MITKLILAGAFALVAAMGVNAEDKINPPACCVKAKAAGKACEKACCAQATKDGKVCSKCATTEKK